MQYTNDPTRRRLLRSTGLAASGMLLGATALGGTVAAQRGSYGVITNARGFERGQRFELVDDLGEDTILCPRRGQSRIAGQRFDTDFSGERGGRGKGTENLVLLNPRFKVGDTLEATQYWGPGTCNRAWAFVLVEKV